MPPFAATTSDEPGRVRVTLAGDCDLAVREELSAILLAAVRRAPVVVVDLTRVDFLDSSGVHGLVAAYREARERGSRLHLENPSGVVATVLDVTGVAALLGPPEEDGAGEAGLTHPAGTGETAAPRVGPSPRAESPGPSGEAGRSRVESAGSGGEVGRSRAESAGSGGEVGRPRAESAGSGGEVGVRRADSRERAGDGGG